MRPKIQRPVLVLVGFIALATLWPAPAQAQWRRHRGAVFISSGYFYDPFFDPWFPYQYPYPYPYPYRGYRFDPGGAIRVEVTPQNAEVYVDGYYAGTADDFDGLFQRLRVPPGEHEVTLYLDGYRAVHQKIYVTPDRTFRLRHTLEKLGAGEQTEPRPTAPAPLQQGLPYPPQPPGAPYPPQRMPPQRVPPPERTPTPQRMPPSDQPPPASDQSRYGTLSIRVQPSSAEIRIDGERWRGPDNDERLIVQLAEGTHRVEIQKDGFKVFSTEIQVRRGETTPLNVSLPPNRE